jgi:hypothetical protein
MVRVEKDDNVRRILEALLNLNELSSLLFDEIEPDRF